MRIDRRQTRRVRSRAVSRLAFAAIVCLLGCTAAEPPEAPRSELRERIPPELWKASNHGRIPLDANGDFVFPETVKRVVVDVGAYKLRRTDRFLRGPKGQDVGLVAIEPMSEPWKEWPDDPRIVGVPAAISLERGTLRFNVNEKDVTSSLLETTENSLLSTKTVEVRDVVGLRLEDVFAAIPDDLPVVFLKTDVQGMDLAVLMSAGPQLRRVKEVHSEIVNDPSYEKKGVGSMSSEQEFNDYMRSMGFSIEKEIPAPERWIVDIFYANDHWKEPRAGS